MSATIVNITPKRASELLAKNTNNRHLSEKKVNEHAAAMSSGAWVFNGDAIRISKSGRLLDGQHRLSAIVKSGTTQQFVLVEGLPDDVFTTIDTGRRRSASDVVGIAGIKNANCVAAAAKLAIVFSKVGKPIIGTHSAQPTNAEILNFAEENPEISKCTSAVYSCRWLKKYGQASLSAFCMFIFKKEFGEEKTKLFFDQLVSGSFSYENSPIRVLRDTLLTESGSVTKTDRIVILGYFFIAMRMFYGSKESRFFRLPKDQLDWFKF